MTLDSVMEFLGIIVVTSPALLLAALGLPLLCGFQLSERVQARLTKAADEVT